MNEDGHRHTVIAYWLEKGKESLDAAADEKAAGRLSFAVNRLYYACFYTVSAVLLSRGLDFRKHSGVRASFHQNLVKTGAVSSSHGELYDELYEARHRGDYLPLVSFPSERIDDWLARVPDLLGVLARLAR